MQQHEHGERPICLNELPLCTDEGLLFFVEVPQCVAEPPQYHIEGQLYAQKVPRHLYAMRIGGYERHQHDMEERKYSIAVAQNIFEIGDDYIDGGIGYREERI
ncbi:hypothetical protein [Sphingobacterium sp. FBM7-1]|uniref:hypothetical protein n=1 Tax=Sphingobacterium sp. FBM7-1 TaxID=2886688 RepID=UPI001D0F8E70|nr:hypothetical protein [Sphingobacterium sp. FBM7-1]MCC2598880.1 hypothetical protein [Sphingobacterium sp. FBM7-1]